MNSIANTSSAREKSTAIALFIEQAKQATSTGLTRIGLDKILNGLVMLASRKEWWTGEQYPEPGNEALQSRYFIHAEPDDSYALYLNVMKPGKESHPHNHTTWACIAAVEGVEDNYLYQREDDGSKPGVAHLTLTGQKRVGIGEGIALMPDDIHAVRIIGDGVIRHLHMYGLVLEKLTERIVFDIDNHTCKPRSIGVKTQQSFTAAATQRRETT